ncbi:uncharacterized protein C8R40DRAFT_1067315 [Lentinula edodes]|uniref:uncharacterized protein n=1 Tax=Lentinula edodes TaxID=5353 RepID=UPI001E8D7388|nr:uncharacterized protein C8R40DRAFT_1067315 [Lentinula edodes]KAH7878286.1 hypothetical protein C8R40DRAFT_1067315 [Lentinula edodes]
MATRFLKFHQFDLQLALQLDNDGRMEVESSFCNYPSWIHINDKKIRSRIWRSASITDQGWGDETVYQIGTAPIGALQTIPLIPEANRNTYGEEDRVAFYPVPDTARPISWLQGITTGMSSAKIRSSSLKEFGAILDDSNSMLGIAPLQHQSQQPVVHFHSVILEAYVPAKYVYVAIPSLLPLILSPTIKILTTVHISRYHEPGFRWVVIVPLHVAGVKGVQNESYQDDAYNGGSEDDQDDDSVYDGGAYDGSDGAYGGSRRAYDGNNSAYDDSNGANDQTVQNPFRDSIINPYLPGYIPPNPVTQRSASQRSASQRSASQRSASQRSASQRSGPRRPAPQLPAPCILKSRYTGEPPAPLKTAGIHFFQNEVDGRFTYQTTAGAFSCSHQAEGEPNRYSDSSCALACYLNLVYVHVLGGFVYLKEHRMFGRAELESRLLGIWVIKRRENKVQIVEDLLAHIDTAFPTLLTNFDSIFRGSVDIRLIKKIPYLPDPKKTACCPFCSLYFTTGTSINKHLRSGDKQCPLSDESRSRRDALEQQWTQSLSKEPANMRYAVRFVDAYDPALDTDDPVPTQTTYKPKLEPLQRPLYYPDTWWRFLAEINFRPLLPIEQQLLGEGLAPGILFDLVRLPSVAIKSYAEGTRESKLEKMLSLCHLFFKLYLMEAAAKVPSTFGFSKMLKKYSGLNYKGGFRRSDTYAKYGGAGTNIICFLLRYFEMKRKKKLPALLRISLGMELLEAVKRLYLESQKDSEPSVSELAPLLHAILVCFVRTHDPLDSDKLTLLEYILLCLTIREDTKAGEDGQCIYEAVVFTRKLSHYARLISATVLQAMVAGGWEEQYHLPSPEDAAISDAELDHIDDSDSDSSSTDSDSLDLENDFDLEDLVEITKFTPEQVTLGERLDKALREYVSKDSTKKNTFRVLISLWARADGYSRSAKGKKSFRPDASNLGFTFIPTPTSEIHCDLAIFPQNHELQLKGLRTSFARLIPASLASYFQENFRTTDLVDDPASPVSIFDQPRNAPYFDGLIATLTNALEQSKGPDRTLARRGQLSSDRVWSWIEDLAEFQKYLAGGIIPTMGVCPRAEQIAALTYATVGTTLRSLKIYQPHVLICNPIAKQDSAKQYECFFALPPDMAWYLILYLGVLRKVVIHLLESPVIRHAGPVEDFKHYIFVILTKGRLNAIPNTYQWTATDVNICLKGTLLRLDANSLRHVTTGVIRHWYPELGEARERLNDSTLMSPVDRQGQHSGRVSRNFYARTIYMTGTGFNTSEFFSQIRVSMALQRLDQIIRNGGRNVVPTAIDISDAWTRNGEHAMNTAREFVMSPAGYNIVSGNTDAIESSFKKLNRLRPFLWGPDVRLSSGNTPLQWKTLGDEALLTVCAALACSYIFQGGAAQPLEVEVDPKFVAHGVYLVNCAVDEWRKGSFQACGWNIDPNREVRVSEIENAIIHFRRDQPEEWITFRGKVGHSILSSIGRPPPQFSKMPFFAPGVFSAPAPPSDIQGEDIPLQDVPLDTIVTSEKGKGREIEDDVQSPYTDVETEIEDGVQSPLFTDIETAIEDGGAGTQSKKTKEVEKQNRREEKKRSKQGADHLLVPGGSKGVWGQKRKRQSKDDNSLKKSRDSTSSD